MAISLPCRAPASWTACSGLSTCTSHGLCDLFCLCATGSRLKLCVSGPQGNTSLAATTMPNTTPKAPRAIDHVIIRGRFVKKASLRKQRSQTTPGRAQRRVLPGYPSPQPIASSISNQQTLLRFFTPSSSQSSTSESCEAPQVIPKKSDLSVNDAADLAAAVLSKGSAQYIKQIMCKLKAGQLNLEGRPWVQPPEPHREALRINSMRSAAGMPAISAVEVCDLVFLPIVFVWDPNLLFPDAVVKCPVCKLPATGAKDWQQVQSLHTLDSTAVCIVARYRCSRCAATARLTHRKKKNLEFRFLANSQQAIALLPGIVQTCWTPRRVDKHTLVDDNFLGMIKAWVTRGTSFAATASAINELRATHVAQKAVRSADVIIKF